MNDRRRVLQLIGGAALLPSLARAQGFAGLGTTGEGFAPVLPNVPLQFPKDHGAHPGFRIEWWYITANLRDASGQEFGIQWTLFRQALAVARAEASGFSDPTVWMGHAAVTRAAGHFFDERFGRGQTGDAGVKALPFEAWIDDWYFKALDGAENLERATLTASSNAFRYTLDLTAKGPLVRHGEQGFSRKSEGGQASYYYSQPFYAAAGAIDIGGTRVEVTGTAWLDREWSSQPLASGQTGWDWFSLHLKSGRKLMLFQLRGKDGLAFRSGTLIEADGRARHLEGEDLAFEPQRTAEVASRQIPVAWRVMVRSIGLDIRTKPMTDQAWMGTSVSYWEGPLSFEGSETGLGYLEMTGY